MDNFINVDFKPDLGRFVIHAPYAALQAMRSIPNRKFEKKLGNAWTAPALRANVIYLKGMLPTRTMFTQAAKVKMEEVLNPSVAVGLPFPSDYGFKTEPFEHQMLALHKSFGRKSFAFFMDMRTGKTKVNIDLAMSYWRSGMLDRLIIIPLKTLRRNWEREFKIHADPACFTIHHLESSEPKAYKKWELENTDKLKIMTVGIESLSAGKAHEMCLHFLRGHKSMVSIDESDSIKNHKTIRTQRCLELRDKAEYRIINTGTPISEGPMDFFAQFEFLDPNIIGIGDFYSFRNHYAVMGGYEDKQIVAYQNMDELTELVRPYVYQVRYQDVFKSPPKINEVRTVAMSPEQSEVYKRIKKDNTIRHFGSDKVALVVQNILEKVLRLQEVAGGHWAEAHDTGKTRTTKFDEIKQVFNYTHHRIPGENPKITELVKILTEEYKEEQGIVWSVFKPEIELIAAELSKHGTVGVLTGDVDEQGRNQLDHDFRSGKIKWLVANSATGARGYTFDAADVMVYFSSSHRYIDRVQSLERATSSKKTKPVMCIDLIAEKTVDEIVLASNDGKQDMADFVRDTLSRTGSVDSLPF